MTVDLVAIGRAYVDEVFDVDSAFLQRHNIPLGEGRACDLSELVLMSAQLPRPLKLPGGATSNTASDFVKLGGSAVFIGKCAADDNGAFFARALKALGVPFPTALSPQPGSTTARCLVFCLPPPERERSFAFNNGCADELAKSDLAAFDREQTKFLLVEALLLRSATSRRLVEELICSASERCRVAVTLHGTSNWDEQPETVRLIVEHAGIVCGNVEEQRAFKRVRGDWNVVAADGQVVVTTMGAQGARAEVSGQVYAANAQPVSDTEFISAVGAGDAFLGGFLSAAVREGSIDACLQSGAEAAAAVLKVLGGRL